MVPSADRDDPSGTPSKTKNETKNLRREKKGLGARLGGSPSVFRRRPLRVVSALNRMEPWR